VSNTSATLQDVASVDDFLNVAATETVPLFEHLDFGFLLEYDVFAQSSDFEEMEEPDDPEAAFKAFSVYGDSDTLIEDIQPYADLLNDNSHFVMRLEYPTMEYEESSAAIQRFADEVIAHVD
jgi:hypothetical protein